MLEESVPPPGHVELNRMLEETKICLQLPERFPFAPVVFETESHASELYKQIKAAVADIQMKMLGSEYERVRIETIIDSIPIECEEAVVVMVKGTPGNEALA